MPAKKTSTIKKEPKKSVRKTGALRVDKTRKDEAEHEAEPRVEAPEEQAEQFAERAPSVSPTARKYFYGVGRRKESTATVKLFTRGASQITINGKPLQKYFTYLEWQEKVTSPLVAVGQLKNLDIDAKVQGGGIIGQAEAVRHAIARALLKLNPVFRKSLRKSGFLTRDPRMKERKKYGLKRARRAPQWSKR